MRTKTSLAHETQDVRRLWDGKNGNYDTSREKIDTIVLHTMTGFTNGTTAWFRNPTKPNGQPNNGSAHYGISQNGTITLWVPENDNAYHAGKYSVNQRSIGIEHEDLAKPNDPRPDSLYISSSALVADICTEYGIPVDRDHIKKHNEISATPCPYNLDVDRIIGGAKSLMQPEEELVSHMLKPTVFKNLVIKSTNYDELWGSLGLDIKLKEKEESYKLILAKIDSMVSEARSKSSNSTDSVLRVGGVAESPDLRDKSIWEKDVFAIIGKLVTLFNRKK